MSGIRYAAAFIVFIAASRVHGELYPVPAIKTEISLPQKLLCIGCILATTSEIAV